MSQSPYRTDLIWGYLAQALNIGAGLLLLPAVLRYLPVEDVGLWFVFMTLAGLAQLLEFGFQPTIARNTAYVFAGATSLTSRGIPESFDTGQQVDLHLLAQLIAACRLIYRGVALGAAAILLLGGSAYILTLLTPAQNIVGSLAAWILYAFGNIANFYFGYVNALLQGRGSVSAANKAIVVSRAAMLVLGIVALATGMGLPGLGVAMLASSVLARWLAFRLLVSDFTTRTALDLTSGASGRPTARKLWHNASRLGIVQVSTFLIQRANVLIASSFLGLAAAATFSLTVTVLMALSTVSMVVVQVRLPYLTRAQTQENTESLQAMYGELVVIGWVTYMIGLIILLSLGTPLLTAIKAKTVLLPHWQLLCFGMVLALELNHSVAATYLTTRNTIPFVRSSILSGIATMVLSLAFVVQYQSIGLIAAQGLVQMAYNNWKWPRLVRQQLGFTWAALVGSAMSRLSTSFSKKSPH